MTREWLTILASHSCSSISEKSCSIIFKHVWNRNDCLIHNVYLNFYGGVYSMVWSNYWPKKNNIQRRMEILKRECHLLVNLFWTDFKSKTNSFLLSRAKSFINTLSTKWILLYLWNSIPRWNIFHSFRLFWRRFTLSTLKHKHVEGFLILDRQMVSLEKSFNEKFRIYF